MERVLYESLERAEDSWWYRGRAYAVGRLLAAEGVRPGEALDFGSGYGAMFSFLTRYGTADAYEPYDAARIASRARGYRRSFSSLEELPASGSYTIIGAFDVLEHIEDDAGAVGRIRQALAPDGVLVVTVPAHPSLWSTHDVENHHVRRYRKQELINLLEQGGFEIGRISYWNCTLLPLTYVLRFLGGGNKEELMPSPLVNALLTALMYAESLWLALLPFPMGVSLVATARPKGAH